MTNKIPTCFKTMLFIDHKQLILTFFTLDPQNICCCKNICIFTLTKGNGVLPYPTVPPQAGLMAPD